VLDIIAFKKVAEIKFIGGKLVKLLQLAHEESKLDTNDVSIKGKTVKLELPELIACIAVTPVVLKIYLIVVT